MIKETIIIITEQNNKNKILKDLSKDKKIYNLKFYSFRELKKKLYFDYDNRALEYIIKKYNVNLKIAKIYLDNLYFLKDLDYSKIKFLNKLKKDLIDNDLLIFNNKFRDYINSKKVIVYGYQALTKEELKIINKLDAKIEFKNNENKNYKPEVYEAKTEVEEVEFVMYKISELLQKKVDLNNIKIIKTDEYNNILKRYALIYNIPLNISNNNLFYSTIVAKNFLDNYEELEIADNINNLKKEYDNINDLITIVNKSVLVSDKKIRKEFIINDFKNTNIKNKVYDKAISIGSINEIYSDEDYVFLLGFNMNSYPKIMRDEDYLSDIIKEDLGLDTSLDVNKMQKDFLINSIKNIKNLVITYKLSKDGASYYPSNLIKTMNLEVMNIDIKRNKSFSKLNTKLLYTAALDNYYKFNIIDNNLDLYKSNLHIPYKEYSNKFTGINNEDLKEYLNYELSLAYTNMEMYNECAFKYYISKILKIDEFQDNFKIRIGNIIHHILEIALIKDINIDVEIINYIKEHDYELSKREYFYLEKLSGELKEILSILKEQNSSSKLNNYLFESEFYVYKDKDDVKVTFKGLIDKVMYTKELDKEVLAVVDYKTGDIVVSLDNLEYGLDMQLPIYLYLLKKSDRFKNAVIAGFYIQKVIDSVPLISDGKSLRDIKKESMRLQGFTTNNKNTILLLDKNYLDNEIFKNLKFKKDGELDSRSKVLSVNEMDDLTKKVEVEIDKCIDNILSGEFSINPKVVNNKNKACLYCKFKEICYKTKLDEVVLGGIKNEVDE